MLGRYECTNEKSNKFWEVEECPESPNGYQVTYGKIGTTGTQQSRTITEAELHKKVSEKLGKGYIKVLGSEHVGRERERQESISRAKKNIKEKTEERNFSMIEALNETQEFDISESLKRIESARAKASEPLRETEATEIEKEIEEAVSELFDLCSPSRCEGTLPKDFEKKHLIAEEKIDGSRYVLYCDCSPYDRTSYNDSPLLSRRSSTSDSKLIDKSANVPHITGLDWKELNLVGTVLDGEICSIDGDFLKVNSIMNSGSGLAISKQESGDRLEYKLFDIMFFRGKDLRGRPWTERRKILEHVISVIDSDYVMATKYVDNKLIKGYYESVVAEGGEGLVVKDSRLGYGIGWAKMKKSYDVSCIVTGMKAGTGRNKSTFGSLAISVWNGDDLLEIGHVAIGKDEIRQEVFDNFEEKYNGCVIDIFAHELQKSTRNPLGRIRHSSFNRFRNDIDSEECTLEKLKNDMKSKSKFKRGA